MGKQRPRVWRGLWAPVFLPVDHIIGETTPSWASGSSPAVRGTPTPPSTPAGPHLIAAGAPGPQALAVMTATPGRPVLPEVDEVHQRLGALGAHETGRVPLLAVACPVWIDHRAVGGGHALAELTDLEGRVGAEPQDTRSSGVHHDPGSSVNASPLLPEWSWASYGTSLSFSFLTCNVE